MGHQLITPGIFATLMTLGCCLFQLRVIIPAPSCPAFQRLSQNKTQLGRAAVPDKGRRSVPLSHFLSIHVTKVIPLDTLLLTIS